MSRLIILAVCVLLAACHDAGGNNGAPPGDAASGDPGLLGDGGDDGDAVGDPLLTHECSVDARLCLSHDARRFCAATPLGRRWQEESCALGSGCVAGLCTSSLCSDECNLGEVDAARTCGLADFASGASVAPDPTGSLHDRARAYNRFAREWATVAGGIGSPSFSDPPSYTDITSMDGLGDSAIWTGTYLAAEALRLQVTGSADARAHVKALVDTLHLWFNVAGDPGMLARWARPAGMVYPFTVPDQECTGRGHCNVSYDGQSWDYVGGISRDQYQGVMLGYALAYEALGEADEPTRALIRDDVVELVAELMKERQVPIKLTLNSVVIPTFTVTLRFVVVATRELNDGAVSFVVDTSSPNDAEMTGFQEFMPDLRDMLSQTPILGGAIPTIPRASSAIMLASFFRVAMLVTDDLPAWAATHASIVDYYLNHSGTGGNIHDWMSIAASTVETETCGEHYYANNITMEPMYNLARLEDDPALRTTIQQDVFQTAYWPKFRATKNTFFSYIYAGTVVGAEADAAPLATVQLRQFPPPPRVRPPVDLRADPRYEPHSADCLDQVDHSMAVDVADRPVSDFLWQRHPWGLLDGGDPNRTEPGIDYLVAYWLGRRHGFIADDSSGKCLVWQ